MTQMESFALARSEYSELLKASEALNGGETVSVEELDEPISLYVKSNLGEQPDSNKISDVNDKPVIHIFCRNESLANDQHPISGVPFETKIIEVEGQLYEVVVPQFERDFEITLPKDLHIAPDREQFSLCNYALRDEIEINPELREKFTPEQIEQIENGDRPDGYVWHHAENPGEMQLVPKEPHDQTGHTGGKSLWGGGTENR